MQVRPIELRVVRQFAGFDAPRVERLSGLMVGRAMGLQHVTAALGERDEGRRGVAAGGRHAADETGSRGAGRGRRARGPLAAPRRLADRSPGPRGTRRPSPASRTSDPRSSYSCVVSVHAFALAASGQVETLGQRRRGINSFARLAGRLRPRLARCRTIGGRDCPT